MFDITRTDGSNLLDFDPCHEGGSRVAAEGAYHRRDRFGAMRGRYCYMAFANSQAHRGVESAPAAAFHINFGPRMELVLNNADPPFRTVRSPKVAAREARGQPLGAAAFHEKDGQVAAGALFFGERALGRPGTAFGAVDFLKAAGDCVTELG